MTGFFVGLAIGLAVAVVVYIYHNVVAADLSTALSDAKAEVEKLKADAQALVAKV